MRQYTITKIREGKPDWDDVPALLIDSHQWAPKVDISARAQLCYDGAALYVRMEAWEKDVLKRFTSLFDLVWYDSCLEFFFCPAWGDERYLDIESNPNGATFVGYGRRIDDLARLIPSNPTQSIVPCETFEFDGGWGVAFTVPFSLVRLFVPDFAPKSGDRIRANCYKCGDDTKHPHYLSWNPIASGAKTFHSPVDFGCMVFE